MARQTTTGPWIVVLALFLGIALGLGSCGGGGSSDYAGGGIGGTGVSTGSITAFGSVFVNGKKFNTSSAVITVEGVNSTEDDLEVGMKVTVAWEDSTAKTIVFEPEVKGPVQVIDPAKGTLVVLGQLVVMKSTTVTRGFDVITELQVDDPVIVSGFFNTKGQISATYVDLLPQAPQEVSVKGIVANLDPIAMEFELNSLLVDYSGIPNPPGLQNGDFVQVAGILAGTTLTANQLDFEDPASPGTPGEEIEVEGIITEILSQTDFVVNGRRVRTNAETRYEHGSAGDIALDARVEVEGTINSSGILIAQKVEFRFRGGRDVKIEGTAHAVDKDNSLITVFGIPVLVTDTTALKDDSSEDLRPFRLEDIQATDFLEIGGFVDSTGNVVAGKIERDDDPGPGNYRLRGAVDKGSENPYDSVGILGVFVDLTDPGITFEDVDDTSIDAVMFFAIIDDTKDPGDIVEVQGDFDSTAGEFRAISAEIEQLIN